MTASDPPPIRSVAGTPAGAVPRAPRSALARLAEAYGVEPVFDDALGRTVETTPQTQAALLAAMGVTATAEVDAATALQALERADWSRPLSPVAVVQAARPEVSVVLAPGTAELAWRVDLEDGGAREGRERVATLRSVEARSIDGTRLERRILRPGNLPLGYHRLTVRAAASGEPATAGARASEAASTSLIAVPERCWLPPEIEGGGRIAGISAQLYLLRSAADWGIGDFGMLGRLAEAAAARGCHVLGLNPLHVMFPDAPERASPYSPASRLFLNPLYIDIPALPEFAADERTRAIVATPDFQARLAACHAADTVDYRAVTALKLEVLSRLFVHFTREATPGRRTAFEAFRQDGGEALERTSIFLAMRSRYAADGPEGADWRTWPEPCRRPDSPQVRRFAEENRPAIEFLDWLQWLADDQLAAAQARARDAGMSVGIYRDLAVGADRAGAETWANPEAVIAGATVGAPPDIFNPAGQNWGLPPFNPRALRQEGYRSFIQLVRANMRHAGGLRIDHVMGLQRLYCMPDGAGPEMGAYVRYPVDDLIGILALESRRHRCLVVGEDLGTVPEGFRERMEAAGMLSYKILFFEQDFDTGDFRSPTDYQHLAIAATGSHDLPTVAAWWRGLDIDLKERLGLYPDPGEAAAQRERRARDRDGLLTMLAAEGLIPQPVDPDTTGPGEAIAARNTAEQDKPEKGIPARKTTSAGMPDEDTIVAAVHAALGRSASALVVVQVDDLMGETDPVNVPGTDTEHPNWRRRAARTLEDLEHDTALWTFVETVRQHQPAGDGGVGRS